LPQKLTNKKVFEAINALSCMRSLHINRTHDPHASGCDRIVDDTSSLSGNDTHTPTIGDIANEDVKKKGYTDRKYKLDPNFMMKS
jgi:hypothetical protein